MQQFGDIVYRKCIKFKDAKKTDYKLSGHPTINLSVGSDGYYYCVVLTSNKKLAKYNRNFFYKLENKKSTGLYYDTFVNLRYIYKIPMDAMIEDRYVDDKQMNEICTQLIDIFDNVRENNQDLEEKTMDNILKNLRQFVNGSEPKF